MDRDLILLAFAVLLVFAVGAIWLRLVTVLLQGRWPPPFGAPAADPAPAAPHPRHQIEANS